MDFSVSNLACVRGDITILCNLGFQVAAGEALILRGPNGSGKTTLLRCISGLTPPVSGDMSFASDDVAYAGHADGLKSQLTVAENLNFWAAIYGATDIDPAITAFDLAPLLDRRAQFLSAGQKRRLSLARLLLTGRPLWALDEPTVSLDTATVEKFATAIGAHIEAGGAAIIATHIDLGLTNARTLDISPFRATEAQTTDPFLDEALS